MKMLIIIYLVALIVGCVGWGSALDKSFALGRLRDRFFTLTCLFLMVFGLTGIIGLASPGAIDPYWMDLLVAAFWALIIVFVHYFILLRGRWKLFRRARRITGA